MNMSKITLDELKEQTINEIFCAFQEYCPKARELKSLVSLMIYFEAKVLSMIAEIYLKKEKISLSEDRILDLARTCKEAIKNSTITTTDPQIKLYAQAIVEYAKDFMAVGLRDNPTIDSSVKLLAGYVISFAYDLTNAIKFIFENKDQQANYTQSVYVGVMEKIYNHYTQDQNAAGKSISFRKSMTLSTTKAVA